MVSRISPSPRLPHLSSLLDGAIASHDNSVESRLQLDASRTPGRQLLAVTLGRQHYTLGPIVSNAISQAGRSAALPKRDWGGVISGP